MPVETAPPPLEGDPVLVGVPPDEPDLVGEGDPVRVDEGEPEPVLDGGWP